MTESNLLPSWPLEHRIEQLHRIGSKSLDLANLESLAFHLMRIHDESFANMDPELWQTNYSLRNHNMIVAERLVRIGELRGEGEEDLRIRRIMGDLHDFGKLHPICKAYRRRKSFKRDDPEKLNIHQHPVFSFQFVCYVRKLVQPDLWLTLEKARAGIRWHHWPAKVEDPETRIKTWDLNLIDTLVARTEERDLGIPFMAPHDALLAMPETIRANYGNRFPPALGREFWESAEFIESDYHLEAEVIELIERRRDLGR